MASSSFPTINLFLYSFFLFFFYFIFFILSNENFSKETKNLKQINKTNVCHIWSYIYTLSPKSFYVLLFNFNCSMVGFDQGNRDSRLLIFKWVLLAKFLYPWSNWSLIELLISAQRHLLQTCCSNDNEIQLTGLHFYQPRSDNLLIKLRQHIILPSFTKP